MLEKIVVEKCWRRVLAKVASESITEAIAIVYLTGKVQHRTHRKLIREYLANDLNINDLSLENSKTQSVVVLATLFEPQPNVFRLDLKTVLLLCLFLNFPSTMSCSVMKENVNHTEVNTKCARANPR